MAIRRALLTALLVFALAGWAGAPSRRSPTRTCGGCHEPHFTEAGSCDACHRGDPAALRKEIAHHRLLTGRVAAYARADAPAVVEGSRLVERLACRRCHVVGGSGNRLATELDRVVWERDQRELQRSIASPVENMPRFGLAHEESEAVLATLLHLADSTRAEASYRVRFATDVPKAGSVFERHCGGCHRALTPSGPLGRGYAGPNLSGLLSKHYPATARGGSSWSVEALGEWLQNPRRARPMAAMRPVRLSDAELRELAIELDAPRAERGARRAVPD